jgi:NAD(P)-dependent dehydrogenase (short-subunit alcohol dehydrogenase family)
MNAVKIKGSVALVTGADRGLGRAFARELVSRDAAKASLPRDHELIYAPLQQIFYPPTTGSG